MEAAKKFPLVVVAGPTACGKTEAAIRICQWFNGEVVSADSMQIYKYLSVGTAKPDEAEKEGIPHHLMDFLEPSQPFSVAEYVEMAKEKIADIHSRGKLPVIVGGTGLYIDSLVNNVQFTESEGDPALREQLQNYAAEHGNEALWNLLNEKDPEAAANVHFNNVGRVIRAIEMIETTGKTKTEQLEESRREPSPYNTLYLALNYRDRETLYDRINRRVYIMLENGLEEEARFLLEHGYAPTAAQAIGYKEMFGYPKGEETLEEAIEKIQQGSRRYAKRQLTWFRRNENVLWLYPDDFAERKEFLTKVKETVSQWMQL
jgi:tRNA dimethylallyltransferase